MQKSLVAVGGTNHGRVVPIVVQEFRIGRDAMCHLRPASTDISRLHCAIVTHPDGRVFLRDYASSNGTIINQRFLIGGEYELRDGDVLEVGPLAFRVHMQESSKSTLSASVNNTISVPEPIQAVRPSSTHVLVPPPLPRPPVLPGLTTISSVPRYRYSEESALETTPDFLSDSHIFAAHTDDPLVNDTLPNMQALQQQPNRKQPDVVSKLARD